MCELLADLRATARIGNELAIGLDYAPTNFLRGLERLHGIPTRTCCPLYSFDLSFGFGTGEDPANDHLKNIGVQLIVQDIPTSTPLRVQNSDQRWPVLHLQHR